MDEKALRFGWVGSGGQQQVNADKSRLGKARHSTLEVESACVQRGREGEVQ